MKTNTLPDFWQEWLARKMGTNASSLNDSHVYKVLSLNGFEMRSEQELRQLAEKGKEFRKGISACSFSKEELEEAGKRIKRRLSTLKGFQAKLSSKLRKSAPE